MPRWASARQHAVVPPVPSRITQAPECIFSYRCTTVLCRRVSTRRENERQLGGAFPTTSSSVPYACFWCITVRQMYGTYQHCAFTVIRNFRLQNLLASCIREPTSPAWNAAGTLVLKRGFAARGFGSDWRNHAAFVQNVDKILDLQSIEKSFLTLRQLR